LIDPRYVPSLDWLLPIGSFGIALGTLPCYQQLLLAGNREKACGPMEITTGVILVLGSLISAGVSLTALQHWLTASPLAIWLVARSMARRAFRNPREESVA
jgi:type IV secretory pathway TrbD component